MDTNKFAGMTAGRAVMLLLASAVLVPTIDGARMTTTTISNEGAGWAKFAYYEDAEDYSVALSSDGTTLTMGTQSGTADDMIVWASDAAAVIHDAGSFTLLYENGDSSAAANLGSSANIASVSGALTITDSSSTEVYTSDAVEWTYTPNAGGSFGFFTNSGATVKDFPTATAGTFAGVYAYNENNSINYATLAPTYSVADEVFTMGPWTVPNLGAKTVNPIVEEKEVKEIEEKEIAIKSATPSYTDGDWGFNLNGTNATIVSYSGTAGDISIPATVSNGNTTYAVKAIGDGFNPVFDNTTIRGSTLTIPDSITSFNKYSLRGCSGFTGTLVIPNSITSIAIGVFSGCSGFTGTLVIPNSVVSIGNQAFMDCSGFTGTLVLPRVVSIGNQAFSGCSGITDLVILRSPSLGSVSPLGFPNLAEVLNLGNTAIAAGSDGIPATATVSDEISSLGYLAPVSFSETTAKEGAVYDMLAAIPLLIIASILLAVTSMIIVRRE